MVGEITRLDGSGCDGSSPCGDLTVIYLTNLATDDTTPAAKIGYRLTVVAGGGFTPYPYAVEPIGINDTLPLYLGTHSDDIDFTLEVVAVDSAGNTSAPQTVRVRDDAGMCSIGRRGPAGLATLAMGAIALLVVARRRRRRIVVLLAVVALVSPSRARACEPIGPNPTRPDPAMVGVDQTPPVLPSPWSARSGAARDKAASARRSAAASER